MQIYCVKCREKVNIPNDQIDEVKWKKNSRTGKRAVAARGECPHCGTRCHQILRLE